MPNANQIYQQRLFNRIALHLLNQGRQAKNKHGDCVYRAPNGDKCAAGCLIPESKYNENFEGRSCIRMTEPDTQKDFEFKNPFTPKTTDNIDLVWEFQRMHDNVYPSEWYGEIVEIAKEHELNTKAIDKWLKENG